MTKKKESETDSKLEKEVINENEEIFEDDDEPNGVIPVRVHILLGLQRSCVYIYKKCARPSLYTFVLGDVTASINSVLAKLGVFDRALRVSKWRL